MIRPRLANTSRSSDWSATTVLVAGLGQSGTAAVRRLDLLGANLVVFDDRDQSQWRSQVPASARILARADDLATDIDLVIASPGLSPRHELLQRARNEHIAVWSGEQLAWQLQAPSPPAWLTVTGTNGKTTTVQLLAAILAADGKSVGVAGNIGRPLIEAVFDQPSPDVLAVELSSFQLHYTESIYAHTSALLNIGVDHLDWHGDMESYIADKSRILHGTTNTMVFNLDDDRVVELVRQSRSGARQVGFTLGPPQAGQVGVVDGAVVDRAFAGSESTVMTTIADWTDSALRAAHQVSNAVAATAIARSYGVSELAVDRGLRSFRVADHRGSVIDTVGGVVYVDDSKATNVDAAMVSLAGFDSVVWVAGGVSKGAVFDDLVAANAARLRAAVLMGVDSAQIERSLQRHAPQVPVIVVEGGETGLMDLVVDAAAGVATPGDTVLLAPACASTDQFSDYAARGDAFASAVLRLRRAR